MADDLFFEQLDGKRTKIFLRGTEAPHDHFRGEPAFSLGGTLDLAKRKELGMRRPVVHVFSSSERPIVVKGHLRDSLTGEKGRADEMLRRIDAVRQEGRELRIVWRKHLRRGLLVETDFGVEADGEYTFVLTFEVFDQGEGQKRRRRSLGGVASLPGSLASMEETLNATKVSLAIPGLHFDFDGKLQEMFSAITKPFSDLLALGEDIEAGIGDLEAGLKQMANQARALLHRARDLVGFLSSATDPFDDDGAVAAAWQRARLDAIAALQRVATQAFDIGLTAERKLQGTTGGKTYVTKAGDTLEDLAVRFATSVSVLRKLNPSVTFILGPGLTIKLP